MADTTNKGLERPAYNQYSGDPTGWTDAVNTNWAEIDEAFGGVTPLNVTAVSGVTALTVTQYRKLILAISGTLTANVTYRIPSGIGGQWIIINSTTGAFDVTIDSGGAGTSVVTTQGGQMIVASDGTNIRVAGTSPISEFASGTRMLFQQTTAPDGWTKDVTTDDAALRLVSGTVGSGGTVDFTVAFASQAVDGAVGGTALTEAQMPNHEHFTAAAVVVTGTVNAGQYVGYVRNAGGGNDYALGGTTTEANVGRSSAEGGDEEHDHSFAGTAIDLAVKYVDTIVAEKD
jgi:hypothetical protein